MRRYRALILAAIVFAVLIPSGLAQVEIRAAGGPQLAVKDLMLAELSSIRRDVAHDRWGTAWSRTGKLNSLWAQYRKTHAVKKSTVDNFAKNFHQLQSHLKERSAAKVYVDLGALRTIVALLKA